MQTLAASTGSYTENALGAALALLALASLGVGLWVVIRERARRVSLAFLAGAGAIGIYLMGFSFMVRSPGPETALFWAKVAYLGVPFIVPTLYHFSMELLGLARDRKGWIAAAWVVGVVYAVLAVATDLLMVGVTRASWGFYTDLRPLRNAPFLLWSMLLMILMVRDYWSAYLRADRVQRARIRWLAIPLLVASIAFIDYGPSLGFDWPPVGFVFLAVFLVGAARVVARYHLPDLTPAFAADRILDTIAEPLLVVDQLGRIAIVNPATARLLGWSQDELRQKRLPVVLGAELARELVAEPEIQGREVEIVGRDGEPIAVSVSTSHLVVNERRVGTVIVARDIRERRRAARRLEQREQYFRALIENARDTITILDSEGEVLYQSPSHTEVLGRGPGESVGASVFQRIHPDDREAVQERFAELVAEPGGTARMEARIRHSDGEYRILDFRAQNLLDHPAVQGIVVNGRDVTQEHRLADELQRSQRLEAIGRLAGGIAHDFNNVLTTIQGAVALMEEQLPDDVRPTDELQAIRDGAERAGRLTSQLLAFGRQQLTQPEVLDPGRMVRDLASGLQRLLEAGQRLEIRTEEGVGAVRVDRGQLEDVIVDLVLNARDAMGEDGRLEIAVSCVRLSAAETAELPIETGSYVCLSIRDDGQGMDAATAERIFDPFFTTRDEGPSGGLGLASVYGAVRQAGGHIEVESEPGDGTTFRIYLPAVRGPKESSVAASQPDEPEAGDSGEGKVVLVVEDEDPVRKLITRVLERSGYRVLSAATGSAALETAAAHAGEIDLLIADLVMPGMSGRQVAERLASDFPGLATILISGYTADEVVREGIDRGEYDFLPKPFDPATLSRRVAGVLEGRQPA